MIKECIICGTSVSVNHNSEIIVCNGDYCIKSVEEHIGLPYQSGSVVFPFSEHFGLIRPDNFTGQLHI